MSLAALCAFTILQGDGAVHLTPLAKGASPKLNRAAPQTAPFEAARPASIKQLPKDLRAASYGVIPIGGDKGIAFVLDEPKDKPARLIVDSNANGDLTDDVDAEWIGMEVHEKDGSKTMAYQGSALVDIGEPGSPWLVNLVLSRKANPDPARAKENKGISYVRDYGYEGDLELGGKRLHAMLSDALSRGDFRGKEPADKASKQGSGVFLLLDVNANGKFDARGESFDVQKPFNIGGTTWEIAEMARSGASFKIVKSRETVAEIPTPPDHSVGQTITSFTTKDTEGKTVNFPADFKGKLVLLDFWATWCGPCMGEVPHVVATYKKFHAQGFEILGISLDSAQTIDSMPGVMKKEGMTWRQVADGKYWDAEIAQLYVIRSIPATFLVDGTSGKILGVGLRGEELAKAVEKALPGIKPAQ